MNLRTSISALIGSFTLALALACGGGGDTPPAPAGIAVTVSPTTPSVVVSGNQTFTATVTGSTNTSVTWSVQEGAAGGTITTGGVYTAPASTGTYHVIATSVADTAKKATATVTVTAAPVVAVTVSPATPSVVVNTNQTFTAAVTGSTNTAVTWSVQEGASGGTITSGGVYTAPASTGTYHVVATSVADATKSATATVTVTAAPVVAVALDYTNPTTGAYRLVKNDTLSTATHLVFDVTGISAPSGAGIAFTFSVDSARATWSKVAGGDVEFVANGNVLTLGTPQPLKGKVSGASLVGVVGQKGTGSSLTLNGALARVALDLVTGAPIGTVTLTSPKARILEANGAITDVTITVGTLTAN